MVAVFHGAAHKQQHRVHGMAQDVARRVGGFVGLVRRALGAAGRAGGLDLLRQHRAVQRDAVIHRADVHTQRGEALDTAGQVEQLLVGLHRAALGKIGQVGVRVAVGHIGAQQRIGGHRVKCLAVGVAVGPVGRKEETLPQHCRADVALLQGLHPECDLAGRGAAVVVHVIIQPLDVVFQRTLAADLGLVGFVRLCGAALDRAVCVLRRRGLHCGLPAAQRIGQKARIQQQRQRQTGGQIGALLRPGVVSQPRGGHQQQQCRQRQIDELARGQQHAAEQQRRQPGGGERLFLIRAERRVHQQRREHKAQPQQRRVPAEAGRQVQRHGQQRGHGKDPLAERRGLDRQRRQRRKEQQICKPPQKQRGRKAKMQHIGQKYCRRTDDIQKRVLVGLQFIIFLMAVKGLVCGGEQLGGERLPRKDRRVLVLQVGVLVTDAAEARRRGHLTHPPLVMGQVVGPAAGQRKALVDVIFLVGRSIRRQHKAVQQSKAEHQHKNKTVQCQFFAKHRPHGQRGQHGGQPAHKQEEPRQVAADALVGDLHRHRAVDHTVIHGHLLLPERDTVAVADGQNRVRRVVRRDGQLVAAALLPGHGGVHPQGRVLVGHDVVHRADGAGQLLAGVGVVEHNVQRTAGLVTRQVKFKTYRQNILVVGKDLRCGLAVLQKLGPQEVGDDLTAALAHIGPDLRQPDQHHARQQHDKRCQCRQQGGMFFVFHEISFR